jgi:fumarate hydratase class I
VIDQHLLPASRSIDLNSLRRDEVRTWRAGDALLLSGKLLTGRDAAHKRIVDLLASGQPMPSGLSFRERVIYYVGPVDPVGDEVVGPAGPTTASRMDRYTDTMLEKAGLIAMIGKGERGPDCIEALKRHGAAYLIAVGGAAYLISKAIRTARLLAFPELGMEAVYEFDVKDLPVIVAVDATGTSVHTEGPKQWRRQAQLNQL